MNYNDIVVGKVRRITLDTMHIEAIMTTLGLKRTKAKVYLAALEIGVGSAQRIAERAKVPRTTAHEVLTELVARGLVSYSSEGRRRIYSAEPPTKLRDLLVDQTRKLEALLPELAAVFHTVEARPRMRFYEGEAGMRTVLDDTLTTPDKKLFSILSVVDLFTIPGRSTMLDYVRRRVQAGIKLRVIRSLAKDIAELWPSSQRELRELRYAPAGMVFPLTVYVYGHKVGFIGTERESFGVILESAELAQTMKNLMEVFWSVSRPGKRVD
jgi:sugar-specific transcriptional regulator TrmB